MLGAPFEVFYPEGTRLGFRGLATAASPLCKPLKNVSRADLHRPAPLGSACMSQVSHITTSSWIQSTLPEPQRHHVLGVRGWGWPCGCPRLEDESDARMGQGEGVKESAQSSTAVLIPFTTAREVPAQHHRPTTMLW